MMSTVLGGAMLPHAPQFFTMPETEDRANVEKVRAVALWVALAHNVMRMVALRAAAANG